QIVAGVRQLDGKSLGFPGRITCSLGTAWSDRPSVNSAEELFAAADQLMYKAKRRGKDCYVFGLLTEPYGPTQDGDGAGCGPAKSTRPSREAEAREGGSATFEEMAAIAKQLNDNEVDTFAGIRKQGRAKLTVPCVVHYFTGDGTEMRAEQAATRNVSTGGAGLLIGRPLARGEAVEIVLDRGASKLFLAGLVSFCRHIVGGIHEVGVQFVTHSVTPIICADTSGALRTFDWVARAFHGRQDRKPEPQVPV
ncbi:MAG: PilZ domain-containing protein, partial [Planctomycetes bacterium]|nr:PilZ domain-containing protein [Planctomycetota bacterium]